MSDKRLEAIFERQLKHFIALSVGMMLVLFAGVFLGMQFG